MTDCPPVRPHGVSIDPPKWDAFSAAHTTTPIAAYATADPTCARYGARYFADDDALERFLLTHEALHSDTVYRWDLNRETGEWTRTTIWPRQELPDLEKRKRRLARLRRGYARIGHFPDRHRKTDSHYWMLVDEIAAAERRPAGPFAEEVQRLRSALERIAEQGEANAHFPKMADVAAFARAALAGEDGAP